MGFTLETSIPALTVFLQGIFSFFSPCVLPLMPLYMGYLSGGTKIIGADGVLRYPRKKALRFSCWVLALPPPGGS